jgi:hypothetical protein
MPVPVQYSSRILAGSPTSTATSTPLLWCVNLNGIQGIQQSSAVREIMNRNWSKGHSCRKMRRAQVARTSTDDACPPAQPQVHVHVDVHTHRWHFTLIPHSRSNARAEQWQRTRTATTNPNILLLRGAGATRSAWRAAQHKGRRHGSAG